MKKHLLINGGFLLALAILTIIGTLGYINIKEMHEEERWEHHTYDVSREFDELLLALKDVETGELGFVITGNEKLLEPYNSALGRIEQKLARLRELTAEDSRHEDHLVNIQALLREKLANAGKIIELRRTADFQAASQAITA